MAKFVISGGKVASAARLESKSDGVRIVCLVGGNSLTVKRQFNTEKNVTPLAIQHEKTSTVKITMNRIFLILTVVFWLVYVGSTIFDQWTQGNGSFRQVIEAALYIMIMTLLCFSAFVYLVSRNGALIRFREHTRVPRELLDDHFAENHSEITVLVPSYDEEIAVIRKTMLSAMLQEYPAIRVCLLIDDDDKPNPTTPQALTKLNATKALANELEALLAAPSKRFAKARQQFLAQAGKTVTSKDLLTLAREYRYAEKWLQELAETEPNNDHVDAFFADQVLRELAKELGLQGLALEKAAENQAQLPLKKVKQMYSRLVWTFTAEADYFQRKEYVSLSHEANKAMNLNAYIDLMGGRYRIEETPRGKVLVPVAANQKADLEIPDSEFLLTLDADSVLLREYCLRLVYLLQQPGNEKVAVTQTPYSSFRGCPTRIERIAGATTDIQHILHQGTTYYGATFWVGANAVIRKNALMDIAESEQVNGFEIRRFIQDRTVIEDTESSVDLEKHGWRLVNYPERLSYSATPPDFGSLMIQRRRWANGGLLILPKLFATMKERRRQGKPLKLMEVLLRMNYMTSIAWASFGLIFLLVYPFDDRLLSVYIVCAALPYFLAMASDLRYCRYKRKDVFRIYGFNLILLAVNMAGVLKSLQQFLTGEKIPFARTPKINDRTACTSLYLIAPLVIIVFSLFTIWRSWLAGNWQNALFATFNAVTCGWATLAYIGPVNLAVDLAHNFYNWLFVEVTPEAVTQSTAAKDELDWQTVLYYGEAQGEVPLKVSLQGDMGAAIQEEKNI